LSGKAARPDHPMGRAATWLKTESEGPEAGSLRPLLALLSKSSQFALALAA